MCADQAAATAPLRNSNNLLEVIGMRDRRTTDKPTCKLTGSNMVQERQLTEAIWCIEEIDTSERGKLT